MKKSTRIRSVDVPQADSLPSVRRVVEALNDEKQEVALISKHTGFSERHVRYRLQAARILQLLDEDLSLTPAGKRLAETTPGSCAELEILRACARSSAIIMALAPNLLGTTPLDRQSVSERIHSLAGLSPATAHRRAGVLLAWQKQLTKTPITKGEVVV